MSTSANQSINQEVQTVETKVSELTPHIRAIAHSLAQRKAQKLEAALVDRLQELTDETTDILKTDADGGQTKTHVEKLTLKMWMKDGAVDLAGKVLWLILAAIVGAALTHIHVPHGWEGFHHFLHEAVRP